jgi:hypothetical protein
MCLMKDASVLEGEDHCLYQSIIGSYIYLVTKTSPDVTYLVFILSEFLGALSNSHVMDTKCIQRYIKDTKNLKLSISCSNVLEIAFNGYSDSDYENCLDAWQSILGIFFSSTSQQSIDVLLNQRQWRVLCITLNI